MIQYNEFNYNSMREINCKYFKPIKKNFDKMNLS